ncbi:MAG: hypothetical protein JNM79_02810 [Burkholderiales bacterium]|nr:hypothetical protein [Burkholderiales bacterium]
MILAKIAAAHDAPARANDRGVREETGGAGTSVRELLLPVPEQVDPILWIVRAATLVAFVLWTAWIFAGVDIAAGAAGSFFLWAILTPFHEAGHYLIFRWFGEFIMILGGTLAQHGMPLLLAGLLLFKRRDAYGAALFLWLFGWSWIMMAVYMYDAFDPRMLLLDGRTGADSDGHDWQNIFGDLGLLKSARGIGLLCGGIGRVIMVASLLWAALVLWRMRARRSDNPFAETGDLD